MLSSCIFLVIILSVISVFCIKCFHQGGYVIVLVCWFDLCEIFEGIFWGDLDLGIFFYFQFAIYGFS